ncbi:MAG: VacJ family lipoprotein [Bacillota bacterium]
MNSAIRVVVLALTCAVGGCATTTNPKDPFERFNRAMFTFNDALDQHAVKPAAEAYSKVVPAFAQTGIGNFFGNLGDVWTTVNNFLQGKVADGMSDVMRVAVNTFLGFGGVLDIGSEAGLTKHKEDFGQTLGRWGVRSGPYIVLPVLGPSTLRDTAATPLDLTANPWQHKYPVRWRNTGTVIRLVDQRAALLGASNLLEDAALDRYEFVRDAYLQRRESTIHDGDSPRSWYEDDAGPTAYTSENVAEPETKADVKQEPAGVQATSAEPIATKEK